MKWLKHLLWKTVTQDPLYPEVPMSCPEMNIPMPRDLYAKLLNEAEAAGAKISGTRANYKGCSFDWNYDTEAEILHITPDHLPWLFTCTEVESHMNDLIQKTKGSL